MTTLVLHNLFLLFSEVLWCDIAHGSQHRDSSMLQFCLTTSLEVLDAPVSGKSGGVPESGRSLHTQLVFEVLFVALGLRSAHGVCSSELSSTFLVLDPTQKQVQEESRCVAKNLWAFLPGLPTRSRRHAKERRCNWPSRPTHCQSSRPAMHRQTSSPHLTYVVIMFS